MCPNTHQCAQECAEEREKALESAMKHQSTLISANADSMSAKKHTIKWTCLKSSLNLENECLQSW